MACGVSLDIVYLVQGGGGEREKEGGRRRGDHSHLLRGCKKTEVTSSGKRKRESTEWRRWGYLLLLEEGEELGEVGACLLKGHGT